MSNSNQEIEITKFKTIPNDYNNVTSVKWIHDNNHILVLSENTIKIYDITNNNFIILETNYNNIFSTNLHQKIVIKSITINNDSTQLAINVAVIKDGYNDYAASG
jgi:non-homologous end joining protein Ku